MYTFVLFDHTTDCEAYSFTTGGYGIYNVLTHLGMCRRHEGRRPDVTLVVDWT